MGTLLRTDGGAERLLAKEDREKDCSPHRHRDTEKEEERRRKKKKEEEEGLIILKAFLCASVSVGFSVFDYAANARARNREMCQASMYLYGVSPRE